MGAVHEPLHPTRNDPALCPLSSPTPTRPASPRRLNQGRARLVTPVEDYAGDTYRAVYTVRFIGAVYALHAFQKKSKKGIETPKQEMDLIRSRLKKAEAHYAEWSQKKE